MTDAEMAAALNKRMRALFGLERRPQMKAFQWLVWGTDQDGKRLALIEVGEQKPPYLIEAENEHQAELKIANRLDTVDSVEIEIVPFAKA
jgi:hypothetical protein